MSAVDTPLQEQIDAAANDLLPTLVVGAGIAGITAAQLLRRDGRHPVLIERASGGRHPGYMLALMPMVDQAIDDLEVRDPYRSHSIGLDRYRVRSHTGRPMRSESMADLLAQYGDYRGISRGALLDVLTTDHAPVSTGTTVDRLQEDSDGVTVTLRTGEERTQARFAVVIIADGIGSTTRDLVATEPPARVDTGWGGWVVWAPQDEAMDLGEELWGTDFMVATYPVVGAVGVFLGGAREDTQAGPEAFVTQVRRRVHSPGARMEAALQAVLDDPDPFYWPLTDVRASRWTTGRTVLVGDAAAGFLPTAGIGAGMAMESAWVLVRMLMHAARDGGPDVAQLLASFEANQRPRVEAAQDNSRTLARWMFRRSRAWATVRDLVVRLASVGLVLGPIRSLLEDLPDPDAAVRRSTARR